MGYEQWNAIEALDKIEDGVFDSAGLTGAPVGLQVDRDLYDSQCDRLNSNMKTRDASQIAKRNV